MVHIQELAGVIGIPCACVWLPPNVVSVTSLLLSLMKICFDMRVRTAGGTSTFIENFARELQQNSHAHQLRFVVSQHSQLPISDEQLLARAPQGNRLAEFQWSQWQLPRLLQQHQCDVYHSLKHVGPLRRRGKSIYRVPAAGQFNRTYPLSRLDHLYWCHLAGRAYRRADLLIAVSQYVADTLAECLRISAERIAVVHNGVDPRFRRLSDEERKGLSLPSQISPGYFLCVGNLVPVKNFATAIGAYALVRAGRRDAPPLVLAGAENRGYAQHLRQLVEQAHLQEAVRFVGYQSADQLLHLYNGAVALVHPSLHEGFSFTLLEAMACGLPMLASSSTSIPETAGRAGLYHEPRNKEQLASLMERILDTPSLRADLGAHGSARVQRFTWTECLRNTFAAYERIA